MAIDIVQANKPPIIQSTKPIAARPEMLTGLSFKVGDNERGLLREKARNSVGSPELLANHTTVGVADIFRGSGERVLGSTNQPPAKPTSPTTRDQNETEGTVGTAGRYFQKLLTNRPPATIPNITDRKLGYSNKPPEHDRNVISITEKDRGETGKILNEPERLRRENGFRFKRRENPTQGTGKEIPGRPGSSVGGIEATPDSRVSIGGVKR
jgi:hypothetical protein